MYLLYEMWRFATAFPRVLLLCFVLNVYLFPWLQLSVISSWFPYFILNPDLIFVPNLYKHCRLDIFTIMSHRYFNFPWREFTIFLPFWTPCPGRTHQYPIWIIQANNLINHFIISPTDTVTDLLWVCSVVSHRSYTGGVITQSKLYLQQVRRLRGITSKAVTPRARVNLFRVRMNI